MHQTGSQLNLVMPAPTHSLTGLLTHHFPSTAPGVPKNHPEAKKLVTEGLLFQSETLLKAKRHPRGEVVHVFAGGRLFQKISGEKMSVVSGKC